MSSNGLVNWSMDSGPLCDFRYHTTRSVSFISIVSSCSWARLQINAFNLSSCEFQNSRVFSVQSILGLCFSSHGSPKIEFWSPSIMTWNHSVIVLLLILKLIRYFSVIALLSLYVLSMFLTLIGVFSHMLLHLWALDLSMNRPSAPQSIKVVISSMFSTVSTLIRMVNLQFGIDCTVTWDKLRLSIGVESISMGKSSTVMLPTVKNPVPYWQAY